MSRRARAQERRQARIQALRARQAALRERSPRQKRVRKRVWALLIAILVLLLLLQDCSCVQAPGTPPPPPVAGPVAPPEPPPEPPDTRRLPRRDRPELHTQPPTSPPWLDAFRLQVAARSTRLAQCFVGASSPRRLKWTTSVEPEHGTVAAHKLDPTLQGEGLSPTEEACALDVLTTPTYRLEGGTDRSTPTRVSLVLEF